MNELKIFVKETEMFNNNTQQFINVEPCVLTLKHSLLSLSKWESKWEIPYLHDNKNKPKTLIQQLDYVRCMTINNNAVDPMVYYALKPNDLKKINEYINDPMTASTFNDKQRKATGRPQIVTSELIYCWMIEFGIPFDPCEKWHLNRLMTLIRACEVNNTSQKKMSKAEIGKQNEELNRIRRARLHSKG